ncbi:hypothetical protein CWR48_13890 [Oceanobacillus arenosus]|uniref:Uncharacterized protein n=1 Tax=Oceanobacillus arenosus TaxID=1229153 RepID=A0A3D8PNQ7_9BACI|nr:hypothetical protein [Oceanobacillus arenosus]RDW17604.1 hypothetical protein CWR48_13890 [Oceanobacillus arenosus]
MNLNDFIQIGINVRSAREEGALGFSTDFLSKKIEIQLGEEAFKNFAEGRKINKEEFNDEFPIRLSFEYNNCLFETIMTDETYNAEFKELYESQFIEEVSSDPIRPRGVSWNEIAMKEAGHKESDFR